jgi:uncharacterized protein (DUF1697 family)
MGSGRVVALARAINVGGRTVPMADLRHLVESLGHTGAATYVQSGNVVFQPAKRVTATTVAELQNAFAARFGFACSFILRTAAELRAVVAACPFPEAGDDPRTVHVGFFAAPPTRERTAKLDPQRSPGDRFVVDGSHIYVHYPNGQGRSKLTLDYLERTLGVAGTMRNWRTVLALLDLVEAGPTS